MKCIILAGGRGTRLGDETEVRPKPMVEIGGKPILWHIMKHLSHYGINEFIVALGYRGDAVKRYFTDETNFAGNIKVDLSTGSVGRELPKEGWKVDLVDTGAHTNTAGRIKKLLPMVAGNRFMVTYGDAVTDLDIAELSVTAKCLFDVHKIPAVVTAVRQPPRFGELMLSDYRVTEIAEKTTLHDDTGWINGGYMIFESSIAYKFYEYSEDHDIAGNVLKDLSCDGLLGPFRHHGFWQCMDNARERDQLEALWDSGKAPWKVWE